MRYRLLNAMLSDVVNFQRVPPGATPGNFQPVTSNVVGADWGDDAWWDSDRDHLVIRMPKGSLRIAVSRVKQFMVGTETDTAAPLKPLPKGK